MSAIGAVSATAATLFYLVALCLFFKPDSKMLAMKVANFSMLAFFIISVVVMLIRWFQVLTYRDKLGQNNLYYRHRGAFKMLLIILGTLCTLFVLITAAGTFLIANMFSNATGKVVSKSNSMFVSNSTESDGFGNSTGNSTDRDWLRGPENSDSGAENGGRRKLCRKGEECGKVQENPAENNMATTEAPGENAHCRNVTLYPTRRDRLECRGGRGGLEQRATSFVRSKFVIAGFLGLSFLGHLVNVCVALCYNGDPRDPLEDGYEPAEDEEKEEEEEDGNVKTGDGKV